jgi:hypothetical protein
VGVTVGARVGSTTTEVTMLTVDDGCVGFGVGVYRATVGSEVDVTIPGVELAGTEVGVLVASRVDSGVLIGMGVSGCSVGLSAWRSSSAFVRKPGVQRKLASKRVIIPINPSPMMTFIYSP